MMRTLWHVIRTYPTPVILPMGFAVLIMHVKTKFSRLLLNVCYRDKFHEIWLKY